MYGYIYLEWKPVCVWGSPSYGLYTCRFMCMCDLEENGFSAVLVRDRVSVLEWQVSYCWLYYHNVYQWFDDTCFLLTDQILEKHLKQDENHILHLTLQLLQVLLLCEKLFSSSTGEFSLEIIRQIKK